MAPILWGFTSAKYLFQMRSSSKIAKTRRDFQEFSQTPIRMSSAYREQTQFLLISEPRDVKTFNSSHHSRGKWMEILESRYRHSDKKTNKARHALSKWETSFTMSISIYRKPADTLKIFQVRHFQPASPLTLLTWHAPTFTTFQQRKTVKFWPVASSQ